MVNPPSHSWKIFGAIAIAATILATPGFASEQLNQQLDILPNNRTQGQARDVADQLLRLGEQEIDDGNYPAGIAAWYQAIEIYTTLGDFQSAGLAYDYIGRAHTDLGNYTEAESVIRRRLAIARDNVDFQGQVYGFNNLGNILIQRGHLIPAEEAFNEALRIAEDIDDPAGIGLSLSNLGLVAKIQGDLEAAQTFYEAATNYRFQAGDLVGQAYSSNSLGQVYLQQGATGSAVGAFRVARAAALEAQHVPTLLTALDGLIELYFERGDLPQVREYIDERIAVSGGTTADVADRLIILVHLGRYYEAIEDPLAATRAYEDALVLAQDLRDSRRRIFLLNRLQELQFQAPARDADADA